LRRAAESCRPARESSPSIFFNSAFSRANSASLAAPAWASSSLTSIPRASTSLPFGVRLSLLEVMTQARGLRLSITTKSDLVLRDIDLLRRIALRNRVHVNLTVTTLDRQLARALEFRAPAPDLRLQAVRTLREAGLTAGVTVSPILPDITDTLANLEAVVAAAREHGATHLFWNVLFLKPSAQQAFFPFLERHFPQHTKRYAVRFARSGFLDRTYQDRIAILVGDLKRTHGFPDHPTFETPAPVHEAETEAEQLPLFRIAAPVVPPPPDGPQTSVGQSPPMGYIHSCPAC